MTRITRRNLTKITATAAAVGALTPLAAPPVFAASNMVRLKIGVLPLVDFAPLYAAKANGFFESERLDVTLTPSPGGAPAFTALASGDLQACVSSNIADLVVAARGLIFPLIGCGAAVGTGFPDDIAALVIPKGSDMMSGKGWNHKRVGVNLLDSIAWLCVRDWVDTHGGDSSTISFVEIPFPQLNDALLNNRVDAIQQNEPFVSALLEDYPQKVEIASWVFSAVLPNSLISGVYASQEYITKNTATIDAFVKAYNKGVVWVQSNMKQEPLYKLISGYSKLPLDKLRHLLTWPRFETKCSPEDFRRLAVKMQKYKLLTEIPNVNELVYSAIRA